MKISVSSYSFRQYIRAGKLPQFDCVAKAKELGFDAIEFIDLAGANLEGQKELAQKLREEADRVGIEINAYTIGARLYQDTQELMDAEVERLQGQLDVAKILGVPVMRHDVCYGLGKTGNARSFDLMLPTIADNVRKVTEYAEILGFKTCSENHGMLVQDSDRVERLFTAVGEGDVPVEQCLRILKKAGYDGYISIEFEGKEDCIEGISKGLKNLKKYIANVEM